MDSLPNLVTNTSIQKCAEMKQNGGYVQGIAYALSKLGAFSNVYDYLDAGHHGWLGWDSNFAPTAQLMLDTVKLTGTSPVAGFITNSANYSALVEPYFTAASTVNGTTVRQSKWVDWNQYVDEQSFALAFRDELVSLGFDSHIGMLIDTSRNGWGGSARPDAASTSTDLNTFVDASRIDRRLHAGNWCNQSGAGRAARGSLVLGSVPAADDERLSAAVNGEEDSRRRHDPGSHDTAAETSPPTLEAHGRRPRDRVSGMSGHRSMVSSILALTLLAGCVSKVKYDRSVQDATGARAAAVRCSADEAAARAEIERLKASLSEAQALAGDKDRTLAQAEVDRHDLETKLDDATAVIQQLRGELERLGKNADALIAEKGSLSKALVDAKARLEELRKAQAAADARLALFHQLAAKLQRMVDAGQLKVALRDGRMVIQLPNDVLFDSGQTALKPDGQRAIAQVADVLKTIPHRRFQVGGHTDDVPIQNARFGSNWELSAARAVQVVRFLVEHGMKGDSISAAGYGEFDPIAPNTDAGGKAKNRRIEIALQPNMDELVGVPEEVTRLSSK